MGPSNHCFLCQRKRSENGGLHRIPKNPKTRPAWLVFCNLDETVDDLSNVLICSSHFLPNDYIEPRAKEMGNKMILKQDSIPSILKPRGSSVSKAINTESRLQTELEPSRLVKWQTENLNVESIQVAGDSTQNEGETTPKRPRPSEPRYVGDIKSPHLATPRRARRSFNLAERIISQQRNKLKIVLQKNRRLTKRIQKLEELVDHLKNRELSRYQIVP